MVIRSSLGGGKTPIGRRERRFLLVLLFVALSLVWAGAHFMLSQIPPNEGLSLQELEKSVMHGRSRGMAGSDSGSRPPWQQHRFVLVTSTPVIEEIVQETREALRRIVTDASASDSVAIGLMDPSSDDQFEANLQGLKNESGLLSIPTLPALVYIPPPFESWNRLLVTKAVDLSLLHQKVLNKLSSGNGSNAGMLLSPRGEDDYPTLLKDAVMSWIRGHGEEVTSGREGQSGRVPAMGPQGQLMSWIRGGGSKSRLQVQMHNDATDKCVCFFLVRELQEEAMGCLEPVLNEQQVGEEGKLGDRSHLGGNPIVRELALFDRIEARDQKGRLLKKHVILYSGLISVQTSDFCNVLIDFCRVPTRKMPSDPSILSRREIEDSNRLAAIASQPSHHRHFTKEGFTKITLPENIYRAFRGFFDVNKAQLLNELWTIDNVFTSQFDAPTLKLTLPEGGFMKPLLFLAQKIMENWLEDKAKLQSVAMYGIRVYTRGTWLAMHVDRPDTHLISGIINVDQSVEEPYALQIVDHGGVEHNVTMEPGEMILYEGATCSHGRAIPLKGRYYANLFVHFRPETS